jgi:tRNA uridine 5-carbamoylmethylation protein Kti12
MKKVLILQGIPGSGKSHLAKKYVAQEMAKDGLVTVVSADYFFYQLGGGKKYAFDVRRLGEAHGACFREFIKAVQRGVDSLVIVDNTNTTANEIAPYVLGGESYGYDVEIVRVLCDPEVAAARNLHGVPLATIHKMAQKINAFDPQPWWKVQTHEGG